MRLVIDIEANGLENPDKIWLIVCKDIDTKEYHIFRRISDDPVVAEEFKTFINNVNTIIGHNLIGYDWPVMCRLLDLHNRENLNLIDTLIVSKLVNFSRKAHSIESYGLEFGLPKGAFSDFSQYSETMEEYCVRDVDICERTYNLYQSIIDDPDWNRALSCEHDFQQIVNDLHDNGFAFDYHGAEKLLARVDKELAKLDEVIHASFPPRLRPVREVVPVLTKHGTLNRKDFRWVKNGDLSIYNGGPFTRCRWEDFNPASHKQVVDILHTAGWRPIERTTSAVKSQREKTRNGNSPLDISKKLRHNANNEEEKYGWKINETNLATLPSSAPPAARSLARRILVESRRRTLTEWLSLVKAQGSDNRIHGKFYSIGAWTHRMAHQAPNTANIPNPTDTQGKTRLYGAEMRSLWCAPTNRLLVGVDAEGIQLRIFAHYINDPEFTEALVNGRKENKSDPHSLNQRVLGSVCKSRAAAKRFIYALLLGAGLGKLSEVLEASRTNTEKALNNLLQRYKGWAYLKEQVIPRDAKAGFFIGLDGRCVRIHGENERDRSHLAMSGYLQNGEAVVMKHATLRWHERLRERGIEFKLVNMVHDEWQTECEENWNTALIIAHEQAESLRWVGEKLKLRCPLAGSYWNDDLKDYTIGKNWKTTH